MLDYDPRRTSLYQPYLEATVFGDTVQHVDAWVCAELSRLVYTPFEHDLAQHARLLSELHLAGFDWIEKFIAGSTQAFAVRLRATGSVVLVFRGTEPDLADFATDVQTWSAPWLMDGTVHGYVHQGFAKALDDVWPDIAHTLGDALQTCIFTGHSLGAALATLAASRVQSPLARLVTIGSPAVGDADFVRTLRDVDIERYVNCCDVVCTMPPAWLGFAPAGTLRYINAAGQLQAVTPDADAMAQDKSDARWDYLHNQAWQVGTVILRDLADHAPMNYIRALMPD